MPQSIRILIVEDEWLIAEDHAAIVRGDGHEVVGPVPSVNAAVACVENGELDAALLDVQLNDETSFPIADLLLARAIPFAFLTGHSGSDLPARFLAVPTLPKPAIHADLSRVIARLAADPS